MIRKYLKPLVSMSPVLEKLYRDIRDELQLTKNPKLCPLGFKFSGNPTMERGDFEAVETDIVLSLMSNVEYVINVGANIGYYVCHALSQGKSVVAFEPMMANQKGLMANVVANGWESNVEVFPVGLSDKTGIVKIYGGGTGASLIKGWAGQQYSTCIPVSTMDLILGDRFSDKRSLIIIDIEGAELSMLQGAKKMLSANVKPLWFIEISVTEHQPDCVEINPYLFETFNLFYNAGYSAYTATSSSRKVYIDEIKAIVASGNDSLKTHNFIFVHDDTESHFPL